MNYSHNVTASFALVSRFLQQRGSSPQIRFSGLSAGDGHDARFLVSFH